MNSDSFYQIMSGICFTMAGLWWVVVEGRKTWILNEKLRSLAGGVYASFLIPGCMALGAQIGGDNRLVWRTVFAVSALLGMFFTLRLLARIRELGHSGFFTRSRWMVALLYGFVLTVSLFPGLATFSGLSAIQVEAFLLVIIILTGHGLAWEMMTSQVSAG